MDAGFTDDFLERLTAARKFDDIGKYAGSVVPLGTGTFGAVFKYKLKDEEAKDDLPKIIAVKLFHQNFQGELKMKVDSLKAREASVQGAIVGEHPNIARCYGYCIVGNAFALALEFCELDLRKYLDRYATGKRLDGKEAKNVVRQLCDGLSFLRGQGRHGIVHRDLKPANVLLRGKGSPLRVAITDFGVARFVRSTDPKLSREGTWAYMAPEILVGEEQGGAPLNVRNAGDMGHACDVYSLGVVGFELVVGHTLPLAGDEGEVRGAFDEKRGDLGDERYVDFLERCLRWDPHQRILKADLLNHEYFI